MKTKLKYYLLVIKMFIMGKSSREIRKMIAELKKKNAILQIRVHFLAFGVDLSSYTDDEIVKEVVFSGERLRRTGLSFKEAMNAFEKLRVAASLVAADFKKILDETDKKTERLYS